MNKEEFKQRLELQIHHAKNCQDVDGNLKGFIKGLEFVKERMLPELAQPKVEECEFNYIDYVHSYDGDYEGEVFQCSNCETEYSPEDVIGGFNYCPTCGRKIKKGE